MSMANSLELRVPFLDHTLVEWAATLPLAWKIGDRDSGPVSKRIVREFCRKRLPADILNRPKRGFPVPAYDWLRGDLGGWAQDLIAGPKCRLRDFFDVSHAIPALARARAGDAGAAHKIWGLIVLEYWMQRWL
jgi:asparagine synthase (glutamine-hydrolysing)